MLRRADVRMIWRSAGVGERAELRVDRNKGIDAGFDLRLQLLIGDLADDAVADVTPGEGRGRCQRRADYRGETNQCAHSISPRLFHQAPPAS